MTKTNKPIRGFDALIGETIVAIDATSINVVTFHLLGGKSIEVDCDEQAYGIAILRATVLPE